MTAKPSLFPSFGRLMVYGVLALATAFFLLPLYAMLVTSFKGAEEIRSSALLALPRGLDGSAWSTAWQSACTGVDCNGLRPFFWNSVAMAVPAVLISTVWGALNGYVLSLWKFRGSDALFGLLLFGVFMPFQVVLLPMSQVLGWLGLASSVWGLMLVHVVAGIPSTTLFFRNHCVGLPDELVKAAMLDGAGDVRRLLLLNATSRGDTLDDVIRSYAGEDIAGCILTKVDETASIAPALDAVVRHGLLLSYVANGQRVPEDLHLPNRNYLLHRAFKQPAPASVHRLKEEELGLVLPAQGASQGSAFA